MYAETSRQVIYDFKEKCCVIVDINIYLLQDKH